MGRAMIANIDAWVRNHTLASASSHPNIADGTLVPLNEYAFPKIPGVNQPHEANEGSRLDFGPNWHAGILSLQPPKVGEPFPVLVPQVDADGNERDGVRLPEITVPLATYAGWNLRDPSIGAPGQPSRCRICHFSRNAADRQVAAFGIDGTSHECSKAAAIISCSAFEICRRFASSRQVAAAVCTSRRTCSACCAERP
jgi:hypothetical protein